MARSPNQHPGRGGGRGRGGRNNNRNSRRPQQPTFKGDCKEMNGEIFILHGHKKTDVYLKTLDAIKNHILATYTQPDDILKALEQQKEFDFTTVKPNRPIHPETTK